MENTHENKTVVADEPVKVTETPPTKEFTGSLLLKTEPFEFCPEALLDEIGFVKGNRPVFILRPLNAKQRHWMNVDERKVAADGLLWAKSNSLDTADLTDKLALIYKSKEFSDWERRREIIRKCIVGFRNEAGIGAFIKADGDDGLHPDIFDRFPDELVNVIDAKLNGLSSLMRDEALGL